MLKELFNIFKQFPDFWENNTLKRHAVIDAIKNREPTLLKHFIQNEKIKNRYATQIDDVLIFDFSSLTAFLRYKTYWADSFTKYRNKIGLSVGSCFIDETADVVLDFPFKDCVLEGGMTKEDAGQNEIYYNEIIAADEIDRLFAPKAFQNIKRYSKNGVEENITSLPENANLIIKGNNLLVLHSLAERYRSKVKLVYIDVPYNTGNDGFKYNDRFNHSTWLTFMKNRLEIVRELLADDGVIFVQCDDNEQAYLKILMDEIFNRDNFIANFIWKSKSGGANDAKFIAIDHEYSLCYGKNISYLKFNLDTGAEVSTQYNLEDEKGKYALERLDKQSLGYMESLDFPIISPDGTEYKVHHKNPNQKIARWRWSKKTVEERYDELVFKDSKVYTKNYQKLGAIARSLLVDERFSRTRTGKTEHTALFGETLFNNPKPENLIKFIIEITTNENDIVLDYHLGSGTTASVAHKMGRQYIGVEQMDYIEMLAVERLKKVIDGEQGGISKAVNWQGGGSFVYAELAELNSIYVSQIIQAANFDDLSKIITEMKAKAHLNYQLSIDKILNDKYEIENVSELVSFSTLSLQEQKKILLGLLDKNQLYVCASEKDDATLNLLDSEKAFTANFYGE